MEPMKWVRQALPEWKELKVEAVDVTYEQAIIQVSALSPPRCPACLGSEVSYHSGYTRTLKDLPWQGRRVEVHFRVRRFRCRGAECSVRSSPSASLDWLAPGRARRSGWTISSGRSAMPWRPALAHGSWHLWASRRVERQYSGGLKGQRWLALNRQCASSVSTTGRGASVSATVRS